MAICLMKLNSSPFVAIRNRLEHHMFVAWGRILLVEKGGFVRTKLASAFAEPLARVNKSSVRGRNEKGEIFNLDVIRVVADSANYVDLGTTWCPPAIKRYQSIKDQILY